MARLRSSKRRTLRKNVAKNYSTISSLPAELIAEVLACLGSSSSDDLFRAKISMKMFNQAAGYNCIYKKVSLKKFPIIPWRSSQELSHFMRRCKESGNPEALFRQGVIDFFSLAQHSDGLEALEKAAKAGHGEALYILGVILLLSGDEYKEKGIELLCGIGKEKGAERRFKEYRENLRAILTSFWIRSPILRAERRPCCEKNDHHKWRTGWEWKDDEISCDAYRCDREVEFVYGLFPRS